MIPSPENPLVVAIDVSDLGRAESLARAVGPAAGMVKVGLELFTAQGPASVVGIRSIAPVLLDLKLHDIPATVERAARNAVLLPVLDQAVDPESVLLVRAFDRHADLLGENAGAAAMIDMAVGEQDLLDRDAGLARSGLEARQVAAGIAGGPL